VARSCSSDFQTSWRSSRKWQVSRGIESVSRSSFLNWILHLSYFPGDPRYSMFNLSLKEPWADNSHFCQSLAGTGTFFLFPYESH
jgi:hypothetical protein